VTKERQGALQEKLGEIQLEKLRLEHKVGDGYMGPPLVSTVKGCYREPGT
jgi:hypothetical protein